MPQKHLLLNAIKRNKTLNVDLLLVNFLDSFDDGILYTPKGWSQINPIVIQI